MGDAVLGSRYRRLTDEEVAGLPAGLEYDHGIALTRARIWPNGRLIAELWSGTTAARSNREARFFGAITSVRSVDTALIVAAGAGEAQRPVGEQRADAPSHVVVTDHSDTREPASARERDATGRGHLTEAPSDSDTHAERVAPVLEPRVAIDLETRALEAAERTPAGLPTGVVHADWGTAAAKRVAATAELHDGAYRAPPPVPIRDAGGLIERMGVRHQSGESVLLGFDFPIGVPRAYAKLVGFENFANWFRALDLDSPFFEVAADLAQVPALARSSPHRSPRRPLVSRHGFTRRSGFPTATCCAVRIVRIAADARPQRCFGRWALRQLVKPHSLVGSTRCDRRSPSLAGHTRSGPSRAPCPNCSDAPTRSSSRRSHRGLRAAGPAYRIARHGKDQPGRPTQGCAMESSNAAPRTPSSPTRNSPHNTRRIRRNARRRGSRRRRRGVARMIQTLRRSPEPELPNDPPASLANLTKVAAMLATGARVWAVRMLAEHPALEVPVTSNSTSRTAPEALGPAASSVAVMTRIRRGTACAT